MTYVLIHGAGGSAWSWHLVVDELGRRGDEAVAVDPAEFQRRVAREGLGITADEMGGVHLPMLARPVELVEHLESFGNQPPAAGV